MVSEWSHWQQVVNIAVEYVNRHGISRSTAKKMYQQMPRLFAHTSTAELATELVEFVTVQASPVVPSMKVTVPPEGTPAVDVTNAEKVTCWPNAEGLGVPVTVVVVAVVEAPMSGATLADIELAAP